MVWKERDQFNSVAQSSPDSATSWIAACQASLSITNSWSSLKLMSVESVMPSSHFILCHPLLLLPPIPPSIRVLSNESTLRMRWPNTGVSALASVLPMNTQDWTPLGWTGWISLQSKGLSRVFSKDILLQEKTKGYFTHFKLLPFKSWIWEHSLKSLNFSSLK